MSKREQTIEILARGVCVCDGQLLVCHTKGAGNTYLPGGHVEFGESAPVSLVREIQEEMGLESQAGRFLGAIEHSFTQNGRPHCEINIVFQLDIPGVIPGQSIPVREGHLDFCWLPVADLGASKLEPHVVRNLIRSWAEGGPAAWASTFGG